MRRNKEEKDMFGGSQTMLWVQKLQTQAFGLEYMNLDFGHVFILFYFISFP